MKVLRIGVPIVTLVLSLASIAVQAEEVKLEHEDMVLNAELSLAEGRSLEDGVILMTHGTLAHARMEIMRSLQSVFKEYGYNTLAINLSLGQSDRHGMYDCADTHTHKHTDALDEIGAWLDWIREQGAEEVVLLGHSRGGNQTAWFAAERDAPAVVAVVLIAPQLWSEDYARQSYQKRFGEDLEPILARAKDMVAKGQGDSLLEGVDFIYCEDTSVTAEAFVNYYDPDPRMDTAHLIPKIDEPVLVFAGTEDQVVKGVEEAVLPLTDSEQVQLEVIDGAGHMFRDLYGYDIADAVEAFLDSKLQ